MTYNPRDHLIQIKDKSGQTKPYYPAPWRLYELSMKHPTANFELDILFLDVEHNLVVVKARLYEGIDYATSERKTEAVKGGPLSSIDKVETAAKARCCRDFGISTESALEYGKPTSMREQAREKERRENIG